MIIDAMQFPVLHFLQKLQNYPSLGCESGSFGFRLQMIYSVIEVYGDEKIISTLREI